VENDIRDNGGHVDRKTSVPVDDGRSLSRGGFRGSHFSHGVNEQLAARHHQSMPVSYFGFPNQGLHVPNIGRYF